MSTCNDLASMRQAAEPIWKILIFCCSNQPRRWRTIWKQFRFGMNPETESDEVLSTEEGLGLNVIQACSIMGVGVSQGPPLSPWFNFFASGKINSRVAIGVRGTILSVKAERSMS